MKTIKTFYLTRDFIEKEIGISNVSVAYAPVTVVNDKAMTAKSYKWGSLDEIKKDEMFKDIKAVGGIVFLYEMDIEYFQSFCEITLSACEMTEDAVYNEFVDDYKDAELFMARLFA